MMIDSFFFAMGFTLFSVAGYHLLALHTKRLWLIILSALFYAYWDPSNTLILFSSILVNYSIVMGMKRSEGVLKKSLLFLGLFLNTGAFFFYKIELAFGVMGVLIPLGLSFYSLQQISYLVDAYEGAIEEHSFLDYFLFIIFFPKLFSGPLANYHDFIRQFKDQNGQGEGETHLELGFFLIAFGIVKKFIFSEFFATMARDGYEHVSSLGFLSSWQTVLSYSLQLYFDFSGYTDLALGLALLFNIKLPQNFNSPFNSKSVIEFWTRWHITLSMFIRTYVFTPIIRFSGSTGTFAMITATLVSMLLMGLWHGISWPFTVYGLLHGSALVLNHFWRMLKFKLSPVIAWAMTFIFINITFIFFRAENVTEALALLKAMIGLSGLPPFSLLGSSGTLGLLAIGFAFYFLLTTRNTGEFQDDFAANIPLRTEGLYFLSSGITSFFLFSELLKYVFLWFPDGINSSNPVDGWIVALATTLRFYFLFDGLLTMGQGLGMIFQESVKGSWPRRQLYRLVEIIHRYHPRLFLLPLWGIFTYVWLQVHRPSTVSGHPVMEQPQLIAVGIVLSLFGLSAYLKHALKQALTTRQAFLLGTLFILTLTFMVMSWMKPIQTPQFIYFRF